MPRASKSISAWTSLRTLVSVSDEKHEFSVLYLPPPARFLPPPAHLSTIPPPIVRSCGTRLGDIGRCRQAYCGVEPKHAASSTSSPYCSPAKHTDTNKPTPQNRWGLSTHQELPLKTANTAPQSYAGKCVSRIAWRAGQPLHRDIAAGLALLLIGCLDDGVRPTCKAPPAAMLTSV